MRLELFGEGPRLNLDNDPAYDRKYSIGSHLDSGFLTVDGTIEPASVPYTRFYFDSLEALETALIAAKLRGDAL